MSILAIKVGREGSFGADEEAESCVTSLVPERANDYTRRVFERISLRLLPTLYSVNDDNNNSK